jgi:hypothetical protein
LAQPLVELVITNPVLNAKSVSGVTFAGYLRPRVSTNLPLANIAFDVGALPQEDTNLIVRPAPELLRALVPNRALVPAGYSGPLVKVERATGLSSNDVVVGRLEVTFGRIPTQEICRVRAPFSLNLPRLKAARAQAGIRVDWPAEPAGLVVESVTDLDRTHAWRVITNTFITADRRKVLTNFIEAPTHYFRLGLP